MGVEMWFVPATQERLRADVREEALMGAGACKSGQILADVGRHA